MNRTRRSESSDRPARDPGVASVQETVAHVMDWIVRIGVGVMVILFFVYAFGLVETETPPDEVAGQWTIGTHQSTDGGEHAPWAWAVSLADSLNLSLWALVFFPLATIALLVVTSIRFAREGHAAYAILVACQIVILVVAALGLITAR
jgi:hypothetical protein